MDEKWVILVNEEAFPEDSPISVVGPFSSQEEAIQWAEPVEHPGYIYTMAGMTLPAEYIKAITGNLGRTDEA